jgi:Fur family transcriptional regulator, zinc uptake regulator
MESCRKKGINNFLILLKKKGVKLTLLRTAILTILYNEKKNLSAYAILDILKKNYPKAKPMTVYRILNFLEEQRVIHRISSANTYFLCNFPINEHYVKLLLCDKCDRVEEIATEKIDSHLNAILKENNFKESIEPIEIRGICPACH